MSASDALNGVQFNDYGEAKIEQFGLTRAATPHPVSEWGDPMDVPLKKVTHTFQRAVNRDQLARYTRRPTGRVTKNVNSTVRLVPHEDGFMIYDGNHRVAAARLRGDATILARLPRSQ